MYAHSYGVYFDIQWPHHMGKCVGMDIAIQVSCHNYYMNQEKTTLSDWAQWMIRDVHM